MKLTRRRKIVLALLAVAVIGVYALLFVPWGLTMADAKRITKGMRLSEVEALFGPSHYSGQLIGRKRATGFNEVWDVSDGFIVINLDGNGPVLEQRVVDVDTDPLPKWKKFLHKLKGISG